MLYIGVLCYIGVKDTYVVHKPRVRVFGFCYRSALIICTYVLIAPSLRLHSTTIHSSMPAMPSPSPSPSPSFPCMYDDCGMMMLLFYVVAVSQNRKKTVHTTTTKTTSSS